jgi:hypothetical protein
MRARPTHGTDCSLPPRIEGRRAKRKQNGVTMAGVSTSQGLRLALAPGGVNVTLGTR